MVFHAKGAVILLLIWIALAAAIPAVHGQEKKFGEYEVKAVFLYNLTKFIEWPDKSLDQKSTLTIYILGDAPFGSSLDAIHGKMYKGKPIVVKKTNSLTILKSSDIIFISHSEKERLEQILKEISGLPVLTVGDTESFAKKGVILNFYIEDQKIRFEINIEAAKHAGLRISSNLLKLGKIISPSTGKKE
jgi:hypothetical protein